MSHTVTLATTGERFRVEAGESILHAALRQGVAIPYGCASGICGVCLSRIETGRIRYPEGLPLALAGEDIRAGRGLCCVGHPCTDLVIEPLSAAQEDWEPWS